MAEVDLTLTGRASEGTLIAQFFVAGRPRTKGSMTPQLSRGPGGRLVVHLVESGEYAVEWKKRMIAKIRKEFGIAPIREGRKVTGFDPAPYAFPVEVETVFRFHREIGADGDVWPSHDTDYPTAIDVGDLDKLLRNLLDALTQSGLIRDDSLVVGSAGTWKRWARDGESAGVGVRILAARDFRLLP